jgi:acyl-CoA synthetase (AMP-forming)/AMP-acid ligase II
MNLFSILEESAGKWPEETAVVHDGRSFRYLDVYSVAESLAAELRELGAEEGDKVGLMLPNGPDYIAVAFAVLRVGGIVISIPPVFKAEEVAHLADEMALDVIGYSARFAPFIPHDRKGVSRRLSVLSDRETLVLHRARDCAPRANRERLLKIQAAAIRFSSGTTGKAKGIIVSHSSLLERAKTYSEAASLRKSDGVLWLRPMARSEIFAFVLQGTRIVIGDAMQTQSLANLIQQHGVTHIYGSPMFYQTILGEKKIVAEDLRGVRYFLSGGSALGKPIADRFGAEYGHEIAEHYGLAECGTVFINTGHDPGKRGSIGVPVRAEAKLLFDDGGELNGEATGELLVRGPGLFDGYYKPWRLRDEVLEDGWFRTGDLARRDADGYYWIVGRNKEVINVGGVKVFPYEIEEVLSSHPAVEEALVYGAPEPRFGEVPHAKVKLVSGMSCTGKELLQQVNQRLSIFKALRGLTLVDEIPKTVTGKSRRSV